MRSITVGMIALVFVGLAPSALLWAQPQEPNFTQTTYVSNSAFDDATGLAWAPGSSNLLFVALKGGSIRVIQAGSLLTTPFTTEPTVYTTAECGLNLYFVLGAPARDSAQRRVAAHPVALVTRTERATGLQPDQFPGGNPTGRTPGCSRFARMNARSTDPITLPTGACAASSSTMRATSTSPGWTPSYM